MYWLIPFLLISSYLFGEESSLDELTTQAVEGQNYNYWGEFVHMLITLLFILVVIFVSIWFLKRIMRSRWKHLNRATGIKILERRALNPKASLYLVTILGKGVVIAESQAGIHTITEFTDEVDIEHLLDQTVEETTRPSLGDRLTKKIRGFTSSHARRAHDRH